LKDKPAAHGYSTSVPILSPTSIELFNISEGELIPDDVEPLGLVGNDIIDGVVFTIELF